MPWWSNLLKIGSVVAAPFSGGASLALLGAGMAGDMFGGGGGGGGSTGDALNRLTGEQENLAKSASDNATKMLAKGDTALDPALEHYTKLFGSRQEALQEIQPASLLRRFDVRRKQMLKDSWRQGGDTSFRRNLPFLAEAELSKGLTDARENAAGKLSEIGLSLSRLGISEQAVAQGGYGSIISGLMRLSENKAQASGALGASIGKIITAMITGGVGGFGGSAGGGSSGGVSSGSGGGWGDFGGQV